MAELPDWLLFYVPIPVVVGLLALEIGFGFAINRGVPMIATKAKNPREYWANIVIHCVIAGLVALMYLYVGMQGMLPGFSNQ